MTCFAFCLHELNKNVISFFQTIFCGFNNENIYEIWLWLQNKIAVSFQLKGFLPVRKQSYCYFIDL